MTGDVHASAWLIRSCVLVCMIAKFTLICLFTSHDVRALSHSMAVRACGREEPKEGAQFLFVLPIQLATDVNLDTYKQTVTHKQRRRDESLAPPESC